MILSKIIKKEGATDGDKRRRTENRGRRTEVGKMIWSKMIKKMKGQRIGIKTK